MLTELQIKTAKPKEKSYFIRDDRGLYLRIDPSGRKYWILRYQDNKKASQLSLGSYPAVSLKDARIKRDEIQNKRAQGESLSRTKEPQTFSEAADEWLKIRMKDKSEGYLKTINLRLKNYILPELGDVPLKEITPRSVLTLCRSLEAKGIFETAARVKVLIGQVFRYSIAAGYADNDPTYSLIGALTPKKEIHYPTFTDEKDIKILMRAIKAYPYIVLRSALLFSVYTVARPGEIRKAEWKEIKGDIWDIPAEKMKMHRRHIVPLSQQAQKVLTELREITGKGRYLFPSPRNDGRCMSENGVRVALRSMGFSKEQIVPHGFRAMFSTIANEKGFNRDVIERQLAHAERNSVRGAYNHAEYINERIKLLQWWSDYLESLL